MRLLIVIPAYNEEKSLPGVVEDLLRHCPDCDYLIVNDGSTDGTAELCRKNSYRMVDLPINLGLSGAFQTGMLFAYEHGYDAAIQFDGDGQHRAEYIRPLVDMLEKGYDIVVGSRFVTVKKPKTLRMFGSYLISFAMRLTTRYKMCDPTSGMRVFNRRMMAHFASDPNFEPEPDTISFLIRCGANVTEVQVEVDERRMGKSYFNFSRSVKYMTRIAISILLIQWFRRNELRESRNRQKGPSPARQGGTDEAGRP